MPEKQHQAGLLARGRWSRRECEMIRDLIDPKLTVAELDEVAIFCNATGLEILAGHVYLSRFSKKLHVEPTIEGFRSIAARYPSYAGSGNPEWIDDQGEIHSVWLNDEPPAAARIEVYRLGDDRPTVGVARWESYVQRGQAGQPRANWQTMPEVMLAAAAERQALSKAFPLQHVRGDRPMEPAEQVAGEIEGDEGG